MLPKLKWNLFFLTDIVEGRGGSSGGRPASPSDPVVDDDEADDDDEGHAHEDRAVVQVLAEAKVAEEFVEAVAVAAAGQLWNDRTGNEAAAAAAEAVDLAVTATSVGQIVFWN